PRVSVSVVHGNRQASPSRLPQHTFVNQRRIAQMDKMLVAIFDSERKACEGSRILRELDAEGSITTFAIAVITKEASGTVIVAQPADRGPLSSEDHTSELQSPI